jgi:copper homeostasis protein
MNADRVELCGRLDLDGITPDRSVIKDAIKSLTIPTKVMIRPRGGNFIYSDSEIEAMESDIEYCKSIGIKEVVLGALTERGDIDIQLTTRLTELANPMKITFHKAIDHACDILSAMQYLTGIRGVTSILTSGGQSNAIEGKTMIKRLIKEFSSQLNIIVAGSITNDNITEVHNIMGAKEYHGKRIVGNLIS